MVFSNIFLLYATSQSYLVVCVFGMRSYWRIPANIKTKCNAEKMTSGWGSSTYHSMRWLYECFPIKNCSYFGTLTRLWRMLRNKISIVLKSKKEVKPAEYKLLFNLTISKIFQNNLLVCMVIFHFLKLWINCEVMQ